MAQDADRSNEDERAAAGRRGQAPSSLRQVLDEGARMNEKYHAPVSRALKSVQDFKAVGIDSER